MSEQLVFYTNPQSRGRIVRWMLEEVGQPYRTEILDYATTLKQPAYLAINPMGKVPAIKHGEVVVTECAAICAYLADAFPQAGLAPPVTDKRRGTYYRWLFFGAGPLEAAVTNKMLGFETKPEQGRMAGYGSLEDALSTAETALKAGDYILGDTFSAADVYFGSELGFFTQFGAIETRPAFERYLGRLMSRPAAVRAREIDDALSPPQPQPTPEPA
ncbi:MAG TPA: glutathione S-transferase family protein [Phenylobacterium sp.]|uniref:glutathione S-transferase family protein n=1 Tax=Phenylobacterium sp. TaxID=1871053 RepID=UPI002B5CA949|nr:glutathione S-transferase family protein [Phenylobacterium sp.]HSV03325.1 glutathione S-transferase family protein [Phenylobacterium sp.]